MVQDPCLACSMVSLRYLHRKYELQPGIERPGLRVPCWTASAIFMKNWDICCFKIIHKRVCTEIVQLTMHWQSKHLSVAHYGKYMLLL